MANDEIKVNRDDMVQVLAALSAAISLLDRGGRRAAPSNKMFEQMLDDCEKALEKGRKYVK
jgi:hypothetical protein